MKIDSSRRGFQRLCSLCTVILLLLSCKITDSIGDEVDILFGRIRDSAEDFKVTEESAPLTASGSTEESESEDDTLQMDPIEELVINMQDLWQPETEPVFSKAVTADSTQIFEIDPFATIMIPPSDLTNDPLQLEINKVINKIPTPMDGMEFLSAYEVNLEDIHQFQYPIMFSLKYDPSVLNPDLPVASQIGVALYDETVGSWTTLPSEINELNNVIFSSSDHLSVIALYLHTQNDDVCETQHFDIAYNRSNIQAATGNMSYTTTSDQCKNHPLFIQAVADYLETAYAGYFSAGFELPSVKIAVNAADLSGSYLFGEESQYDTLTGALVINTLSWGDPDDLRQDCAHELFHYWQQSSIGTYRYLSNPWWMDATADYAADQVAYSTSALGPTNAMGQNIKADYLNDSFTSLTNMHAYSTSHFVDYLMNNSGGYTTFHDLWVASVTSSSSIDDLKSSFTTSLYSSFPEVYRDFASYLLFDANSALPLGDTVWNTAAIKDKIVYSIGDGENNAVAYVKPYASIVYGLRVDDTQFMYLEWTNTNEGEVYVFFDDFGDERTGQRFWKELYSAKRALFAMDPEDTVFIMMINPSSNNLEFDLTYGHSEVEMYTVGFQFEGSETCVEDSAWGSPQMFMELAGGQATLHYDSTTDDYYWHEGAEHTIVASGEGTYDTHTLTASASSIDTVDNGPTPGSISITAQFTLEASPDFAFVWNTTSVTGSSSVNLPATQTFDGYSCSGTVKGVSVNPALYFPISR